MLWCIWIMPLAAQDVHFSQFFMAPLAQNPALAGASASAEATIQYRSQWQSVTNGFNTYALTAHARFQKKKSVKNFWSGGLNVFHDVSGDGQLTTTFASYSAAFHVYVNKVHKLGVGMVAGVGQRRIQTDNFQWGSQYGLNGYDPGMPIGETFTNPSFSYPTLGTGLVWSFDNNSGRVKTSGNNFLKGNMGFSLFHVNRPNYSFNASDEKLAMKYVLHGNFLFSIPGSAIAINPGYMFYRQGPATMAYWGTMVRYQLIQESKYTGAFDEVGVSLGTYVRARDAVVICSLIEMSKFAFGMSYDVNVSTLRPGSGGRGGFEFCLRFSTEGSFFGRSVRMR